MDLIDWFPAITTTGLLTFAAWMGRNVISTRLTKSVEFEFSEKLEALRADLRAGEEKMKADLRAKEAEISGLRSSAMSALSSRQAALDKRRLEAVDQLWTGVIRLGAAKTVVLTMAVVNFEAAAKRAESDPRFRKLFEIMGAGFDPQKLDLVDAAKARPFVTPMAWATFTALGAIIMHGVARWQILKSGFGAKDINDIDAINKLIKTALPHQAEYVDKHGPDGYQYLIEELELRILSELQSMIAGADIDKASVERAAEIIRLSNEVNKKTNEEAMNASG